MNDMELGPVRILERYRLVCLTTALAPWLLVLATYILYLLAQASFGGVFVGLEVCQHVTLASPLLGWALARRSLRGLHLPAGGRRWIVSSPAPLWALVDCIVSAALTLTAWALVYLPQLYYVALIAVLLVYVGRIGLNLFWLSTALRSASGVAVLERTDHGTLALRGFDGVHRVSLTKLVESAGELHLAKGGRVEVWRAIGLIEGLARVDAAQGKEDA